MHLRFCMQTASENKNTSGHPELVMHELGITYQVATPQSIGDQWWFWNCENIPEELPKFLSELKLDPMRCINSGIDENEAEKIGIIKNNS
jgi:hypothetical protein